MTTPTSLPQTAALALTLAAALAWAGAPLAAQGEAPACPTGPWEPPPCPFPNPDPDPMAPWICHPYPQPRPAPTAQTTACDGNECSTRAVTGGGIFQKSNPWNYRTFPGTNFLPTVYTNMYDGFGVEMANTLPSTPDVPYNLHAADPVLREINPTSPADDLRGVFDSLRGWSADVVRLTTSPPPNKQQSHIRGEIELLETFIDQAITRGLDVLEGEPLANRAYSGLPVLHYAGPEKTRRVSPITDDRGEVVSGHVDVHQVWFGQHIEADVAYLDPTEVWHVPWTITYTVDVLARGHDDFSPFAIFRDDPAASPWIDKKTGGPCTTLDPETRKQLARNNSLGELTPSEREELARLEEQCQPKGPLPHVGMDQSFFNMEEGTRTIFEIKMPPGKYLNLIYTWGWRMHPPRVQVMENATKRVSYPPAGSDNASLRQEKNPACPMDYAGNTLPQLEQAVFCRPGDAACETIDPTKAQVRCAPGEPRFEPDGSPTECERRKLYAIGQIGDLSPAKRMWHALRAARHAAAAGDYALVNEVIGRWAVPAWLSWNDRTLLPCYENNEEDECIDKMSSDPDSDITILYVNNTIYGELTAGGWVRWPEWEERPATLHVSVHNGDRFVHAYDNVDFGGNRGWENQFKSSVKVAGSGCWFTFGRAHWWMNAGGPNGAICVPSVEEPDFGGHGDDPATLPDGASLEVLRSRREDYRTGKHRVELTFCYEPSRRLRFYQFDPFHHDVAVYSIH